MTRKEILEKTIDFDDAIHRIVRLEEKVSYLEDNFAESREKRIAELEAQIEKMKMCEICKHYRWNHCSYETNIQADCIQNKLKHFELKEIKEND